MSIIGFLLENDFESRECFEILDAFKRGVGGSFFTTKRSTIE